MVCSVLNRIYEKYVAADLYTCLCVPICLSVCTYVDRILTGLTWLNRRFYYLYILIVIAVNRNGICNKRSRMSIHAKTYRIRVWQNMACKNKMLSQK